MELTPRQRKQALLPMAAFIAMMVYVGVFVGTGTGLWSCPFRSITTLSCFGCGMTRAMSAIAHGDLISAWKFNALSIPFLLSFAGISVVHTYEAVVNRRTRLSPVVWIRRHERPIWVAILGVVLVFGIGRMAHEILV